MMWFAVKAQRARGARPSWTGVGRQASTHVCVELLAVLDNVAAAGHAAAGKQHLEQRVTCVHEAPHLDVHGIQACACAWGKGKRTALTK